MRGRVLEGLINEGSLEEIDSNYLGTLPVEILLKIVDFLDSKSFIALGMTSSILYQLSFTHSQYWINQLLKAGCNQKVLNELRKLVIALKALDVVFNYKLLYQNFISLNKVDKNEIAKMWELVCLSGNIYAIQYAFIHKNVTSESYSQLGLTALHYAVASGNLQAVKYVEEIFTELSHADITLLGNHTLIYAAGSGSIEMINYCAAKIAYEHAQGHFELDNQYYGNKISFNPMHAAAYAGHINALDYLHTKFAIPYKTIDIEGTTLLHYAASGGHVNMMQHISKMPGVNTNAENSSHSLPIHLAAEGGHLGACLMALNVLNNNPNQVVYFPTEHLRRNFNQYNAFLFAVHSGNLSLIEIFFKKLSRPIDEVVRKSFYIAAVMGNCNVLSKLKDLSSNEAIRLPSDLLHYAAYAGNELMMKFLVEIGLNPLETNEGEDTILHFAVRSNNVAVIRYAHEFVNPKLRNAQGNDMLLLAIKRENLKAAKLAIKWGCDVNQLLQVKSTLIHAAASCKNIEIMNLLIGACLNIYAVNAKGENALQVALHHNSYDMALYLRSLGVSPLHVNYEGINALQLAARSDKSDALLSQLKTSDLSALSHVIKYGTLEVLKEAYEISDLIQESERQANVNYALCTAAYYGKSDAIDFLIKAGANVGATLEGLNALHYAAIAGNVEVMEQLIGYRVDIQAKVQSSSFHPLGEKLVVGDNILHSAVRAQNIAAIKYILKLNVDLTEPNSEGETPLDTAKSLGIKGQGIVIMIESLLAYSRQNRSLLFIRSALGEDNAVEIKPNNCLSNPQ